MAYQGNTLESLFTASLEASLATDVKFPPLRQMEDAEVSRLLGRLKHQAVAGYVLPVE